MVEGRAHVDLKTPTRSYGTLRLSLAGRHQADNAITAVRLLEALASEQAFQIPARAVATAVEDVVWPARLETISMSSIDVLLDGAHNPAGARALAAHVLETYRQPLPMVVGAMRDKALEALVSALLPAASHFVFTAASTPRAALPIELSNAAARIAPGVAAFIEPQPLAAVSRAAAFGSPVVVAGSLYLAGEIRAARS
jgi:dihydrofolate synthase/folylpolyglutamate synthase